MVRIVIPTGMAARLSEDADRMLAAARERLADYASIETPTGDVAALDAFASRLAARYAELGAVVEQVDSQAGAHVVARWGSSDADAHVLLLGHHDTVWPRGQLESMPFLDEGAVIRGPGVYDMKGGLVVAETAMQLLANRQLSPARSVVLLVVADEEVGSPTARQLVQRYAADAAAVLGLEPPHADGALKTARLGSTRLRVSVTGVEAHAALDPDAGVSAVDELVDQLLWLRELMATEPQVLCNVGTVSGGGRTNVVAGGAWADVGLRFPDGQTEQRVLEALQNLQPVRAGAQVQVETLSKRPAWPGGDNDSLLEAVQAAGHAVGQRVDGRPATGGADTNVAGALGVPALDGFGPLGRGAHAPDEQIRAGTLADRTALLASTLLHL
jgi:glutamate carboxypeptidase